MVAVERLSRRRRRKSCLADFDATDDANGQATN